MNRAINVAFIGLFVLSAHALADDSSRVIATKREQVKDCIQKQKAADVTMSKADLVRFCKDQLKQRKTTGAFPEPPPTEATPIDR